MRLIFRPMLGPTLWVIPMLAILCGLGTWQIQRLHWKEGLLANIHRGMTAPPVPLHDVVPQADAAHIANADYRRVTVRGRFENKQDILFFTTAGGGEPVYHVLAPFLMTDGHTMLVDRGVIPEDLPPSVWHRGDLAGVRGIAGIARKGGAPNWFTPPADKAARIVHTRDPDVLAKAFGIKNIYPMFLEADATPNPGGWPKGGVTVVTLPNNHLQYAITWFGLALALLCIYLGFHATNGRLKWR